MMMRFHKMHGLGNDFVVIDARAVPVAMTEARARAMGDRKTGIGFDQLVLIENSNKADARLRFFNADGGEVEACGNGTRAAAVLLGKPGSFETKGGLLAAEAEGAVARVDMGQPRFEWDQIPLSFAMDTLTMPVGWEDLADPVAVNIGNPHVVLFLEGADDTGPDRVTRMGPAIETDSLFPAKVNVNFARVTGPNALELHTWERGVGHTRACGTGACATAVAAIRRKLVASPVTVTQPGGDVTIEWAPGSAIIMTGPAVHVFSGELDLDQFGA